MSKRHAISVGVTWCFLYTHRCLYSQNQHLSRQRRRITWIAALVLSAFVLFAVMDGNASTYLRTCIKTTYRLAIGRFSFVDWHQKLNVSRSRAKFSSDVPHIHVHIISLARSFERRRACVEELKIQNISYEIFTAVDGLDDSTIHASEIARYAGKNKRKSLHRTSGMSHADLLKARSQYETDSLPEEVRHDLHERLRFGCTLSHVRLWMKLLSTNESFFVILEDDAKVVPNFQKKMLDALRQLPEDWDLFYAFACDTHPGEYLRSNVRQFRGGACTLGYAISRKGADHLIFKSAMGSDLPVDKMMHVPVSRGQVLAFYADPFLVQRINVAHDQSTLAYL